MQRCPECENDVDVEEIEALELDAGETFNCSACGTELKIVSIAPLTIFVGATEALLDDAIALARVAGLADVSVRLEIWPSMFHIWPNYHQVLAQGRQAVARAGRLLREAVEANEIADRSVKP